MFSVFRPEYVFISSSQLWWENYHTNNIKDTCAKRDRQSKAVLFWALCETVTPIMPMICHRNLVIELSFLFRRQGNLDS